jgi:hypothetical protein
LILHVTWSRCFMRFKVLVILLLLIFICKFLTLEMITLAIINHIFWWTLNLWELLLLFIKLIFDIHLLIVFLIYKISSFIFHPSSNYTQTYFRFTLFIFILNA